MIHYVAASVPDISGAKNIDQIRYLICRDMLTRGIPRMHFGDQLIDINEINRPGLEYKFRGDVYQFELDVLDKLEVMNCPLKNVTDKSNGQFTVPHYINHATYYINLPCYCNNEHPTTFKAQHKAATDLLNMWFNLRKDYILMFNNLTEGLDAIQNSPAEMIVKTYYGTADPEMLIGRILF